MTNNIFKLSLGLVFVSTTAFALESVEQILSKDNRVLQSPPRSLRANSADTSQRYNSEKARTSQLDSSDSMTVQPVKSYLDKSGGPGAAQPGVGGVESRYQMRQEHRDQKISKFGFNGQRTFGVGFVGAGVYGVFGAEADFNVGQSWEMGIGLGTGMSYSTWGINGRYFFNEGRVSTFLQFGYANWNLGRVPENKSSVSPNYLANRFFYGNEDTPKFTSAHLVYPGIGMLYQHPSGLAISAQIDYLVHLRDFSGGLTGGVGFYYYF